MTWSTIECAGKSVHVFVPETGTKPNGVVLFLHGYDGITLLDNAAYTQELEKQIIGRAVRLGRKAPLEVVHLLHENESRSVITHA